jgi:hypothetical protein
MLLNKFKKIYARRKFRDGNRISFASKHQGFARKLEFCTRTFKKSSQLHGGQIMIRPAEANGSALAS